MFKQLLSVFLESRCPFCQKTSPQTICQYCFNKLKTHQYKQRDRNLWWGDFPIFAWGRYEGQLKRAIFNMKYHNCPEIGLVLGELLGEAWLASNAIEVQKVTVVPIPLHRRKMKDRGFNQAEKIARGFCQLTGYDLLPQALVRRRETKAMFDLSPEERKQNLKGAFDMGNKLPSHPVLLLDDIYTMGTTIKESTKILRQNKIQVIGSVVVAKTNSFRQL